MRIIHCADLHIGSKMDSKYPAEKAQTRRRELRNAFIRLVEEAEKLEVNAILIAGDAFDSDHPGESDLDYFYGAIRSHPDISFFYLRGNHDMDGYGPNEPLGNLFTFNSKQWQTYSFDNGHVTISGIEINEDNNNDYYDLPGLHIDPKGYNIVMLHGQVDSAINLKKLAHRGIQYVALGHIHHFKEYVMEDHGRAVYPGILEPRGFDEIGAKGYVLIDTNEKSFSFHPFNQRTIHWDKLDISNFRSEYEIADAVKSKLENQNDIYRIELEGEKSPDIRIDIANIISLCKANCFLLDIIDSSKVPTKVEEVDLDKPLIKEFVARIEADGSLTPDERSEAIQLGLQALAGKEF